MRILRIILMLNLVLNAAIAQKASILPAADEILAKVVKGFEGVQDFMVTIEAEIKMERFQAPKMNATIYFKRPDKIHISSEGFFFIPRDGVDLNPAVLRERYDASFGKEDTILGRKMIELQLAAKEKKTRLRQLYVWIDPENWTIAKMETIPYEGRTLSMVFTYECQQDKYWLPSKLVVSFGSITEGEKPSSDTTTQESEQLEQMQRGMPRNGSVIILYSNYKVNVGLDNAIFDEKLK